MIRFFFSPPPPHPNPEWLGAHTFLYKEWTLITFLLVSFGFSLNTNSREVYFCISSHVKNKYNWNHKCVFYRGSTVTPEVAKLWSSRPLTASEDPLIPILCQFDPIYIHTTSSSTIYLVSYLEHPEHYQNTTQQKYYWSLKYTIYSIITHFTPFYTYVLRYVHYEKFNT